MKPRAAAFVACIAAAPIIAHADVWGCTVMLCLGNPNGATAVAACVDPVHEFWHNLRHGGRMPQCEREDRANTTGKDMRIGFGYSWFDPCPEGLQTATGLVLLDGEFTARPGESVPGESGAPSARACVGKLVRRTFATASGDPVPVMVYDRVEWQKPAATPNTVDLYIGGELFNSTRRR